jgi:two-component system NtrC family sensor kinase
VDESRVERTGRGGDRTRGGQAESALDARTRELHLIQTLGRSAAEAKSPEELFRQTVSILQRAEELDLALVASCHSGTAELHCYLSRPFDESCLLRLRRAALAVLGRAADARQIVGTVTELDDYDARRGARRGFDDDEPVVVPVLRRDRPIACLLFLPTGRSGEARLRLLFSAANQLGVHLDRLLTAGEEEVDRFRAILDAMSQPVVLTDEALQVVHANASAGELMRGMGLEDPLDFSAVVGRLAIGEAVESVRRSGQARTDGEARLPDDVRFSYSVSPFDRGAAGPRGLLFVLTDVSESRRMQQRLSQSEKMSSLGQMISGTAHELNNPLSSVLGFVQLLEGSPSADEKTARRLELIRREAERCQRIVQNLLAFARQRPPEHRRLSLNEIVDSVVSLMGYQLRTSGIRVSTELDSSLPPIEGDPHQLQQVFVNLLSNAMHAIHEGGNEGTIRVVSQVRPGEGVRVEIHDSGPGIPPEVRTRIFDPFFTTKGEGKGTGLGLSIVYGIVSSHGASIEALPSETGGACFRLSFPLDAARARAEPRGSVADADESARSLVGRVLVVEDEAALSQMLCEALGREGHRVDAASDGRQALERLAAERYDLIISDMRMPGMDASSLVAEIDRLHPGLRDRLLLITGDTVSPDPEAFASREGLELLLKPFDLDDLCRRVRLRLAARRAAG